LKCKIQSWIQILTVILERLLSKLAAFQILYDDQGELYHKIYLLPPQIVKAEWWYSQFLLWDYQNKPLLLTIACLVYRIQEIGTHICTHIQTYKRAHTCIHTHTRTHTHTHTHTRAHTHTHTHAKTHENIHTRVALEVAHASPHFILHLTNGGMDMFTAFTLHSFSLDHSSHTCGCASLFNGSYI